MYDIIIVGAGPAGLTAAIYAARGGKSVAVFEKLQAGGQIVNTPKIENYPAVNKIAGYEFAMNMLNQAVELGAKVIYEEVLEINDLGKIKTVKTANSIYEAKAVIVATGLTKRKLNIEGETAYAGRGVSYCATCDGAFYRNKDVAVAGGGNTAFEDAIFLSAYCKKVYIIHRRDEFRAEKRLVDAAKKLENVEFVLDTDILRLEGSDTLNKIIVKKKNSEKEEVIFVCGLFIAVGQLPENKLISNAKASLRVCENKNEETESENHKSALKTDEEGYLATDENCNTNIAGIFAAGDIRSKKIRQLTTATADGTVAALTAMEYLNYEL